MILSAVWTLIPETTRILNTHSEHNSHSWHNSLTESVSVSYTMSLGWADGKIDIVKMEKGIKSFISVTVRYETAGECSPSLRNLSKLNFSLIVLSWQRQKELWKKWCGFLYLSMKVFLQICILTLFPMSVKAVHRCASINAYLSEENMSAALLARAKVSKELILANCAVTKGLLGGC